MTAVSPDRRRDHILISPEKITIRPRIPRPRRQRRGASARDTEPDTEEGGTIALASWPASAAGTHPMMNEGQPMTTAIIGAGKTGASLRGTWPAAVNT
jgi:hypothetical protein